MGLFQDGPTCLDTNNNEMSDPVWLWVMYVNMKLTYLLLMLKWV